MQAQRAVDGAHTRLSSQSTLVTTPVVPQRSVRRATARRARSRRATARERRDDIEGRIIEYLQDHPQSTTGDMAKGLNADRATIAAQVSHLVRASEATKAPTGYAAT
jgi:Winged helix-turn-helix DNA-binding